MNQEYLKIVIKFIEDILNLSKKYKDFYFILRFKKTDFFDEEEFKYLINDVKKSNNIFCDNNYKKINSYTLAHNSQLIISKWTSIAEEMLSLNKKVIFYDNEKYITNYDYFLKNYKYLCTNYDDLINKFEYLISNNNIDIKNYGEQYEYDKYYEKIIDYILEKMKLLVIIGNGGHANVVKDIAKDENFNKILFIRLNIDKNKKDLIKIKKILDKYSSSNIYFTIGIGFNFKRKIISETINKNFKGKFKWKSIISNNSIISNDVKIGIGTIIMPGVVINKGVKIGKHCIVNTSSSIDHDNMISNFVSIAPGVNTSGNVQIGEASHYWN